MNRRAVRAIVWLVLGVACLVGLLTYMVITTDYKREELASRYHVTDVIVNQISSVVSFTTTDGKQRCHGTYADETLIVSYCQSIVQPGEIIQ